jgi:penicillin amidase
LHRFRNRAVAALAAAPADERRLLELYTRGVNDGLSALSARPFEYLLLRVTPSPWRPEDSALVAYAMYIDLQYRELESTVVGAILRERVADDMFALLLPNASHWDAPLDHAPSHSSRGSALLASDMHLRLRLPNVWYRLSLVYPDAGGNSRRITGVSLPGTPLVIVGSNGRVAWGLTNSAGSYLDLVGLHYRVPDGGSEQAIRHVESVVVKGAPAVDVSVIEARCRVYKHQNSVPRSG